MCGHAGDVFQVLGSLSISVGTMSGCKVTDGNTDSRGGVWVIDCTPRQGYNISVIMTPYRLTHVSRSTTFGKLKVRAGGTAIVRATIA